MPVYTGDYRRDTQHLSMLEHGAYYLLLMHCWDQKGPVPLDERRIFAICNARSNEEMGAVRNILGEYFVRMDDGWYNRRMQIEIERAEALSGKRANAGRMGYEAKAKVLKRKDVQAFAEQVLSNSSASASTPTPTLTPTLTLTPTENLTLLPSPAGDSADDDHGSGIPACPHAKLVAIYHELLPMLPKIRVGNSNRDAALRARWRQIFSEGHVETAAEGVQFFRDYFARVASSKFLTGQAQPKPGSKPFRADLLWLVTASNFAKVIERGYA